MAVKKRRFAKFRVKSFKRIALFSGVLTVIVIALIALYGAVFSAKPKEVMVEPFATSVAPQVTLADNLVNEGVSDVASAANMSQASRDKAIKEIGESIVKNKGIKVKVVNYSQKNGYSEKVRAILELNGFSVSAGNNKSLKHMPSVIIEKKKNISSEAVTKIVNIRRVKKEIDPDSRFDIEVVIGDDFYF